MIRTRRRRRLILLGLGLAGLAAIVALPILADLDSTLRWADGNRTFLFKPYIQLGDAPRMSVPERAEVVWHAADFDKPWWVEVRPDPKAAWTRTAAPVSTPVRRPGVEPHRIYRAPIVGLTPGGRFGYRVGIGPTALFEAEAHARVAAGTPHRVAVVGDIAAGTSGARRIAFRIGEAKPDLLMITGDIVYSRGRTSEYSTRFFPVYNADIAGPDLGAPLIRSTLALAAAGNHDIATRDLDTYPDALAYFLVWSQPLNGPLKVGDRSSGGLVGAEARRRAFLDAAGPRYPTMANFSYDFGDVHWTVLDANPYVDWTDPALRNWVERDIASTPPGVWRLVAFHQPGFNSSSAHQPEQQMRLLADVFERQGVAIAFGGHVHNYQRTRPLTFARRPQPDGRAQGAYGEVDGSWTLDRDYDGHARTVPQGVIYIISGAGGATLHDTSRAARPETWHDFTERFASTAHSFTIMDVSRDRLSLRQVDAAGAVVDAFDVTRP